MKTLIAVLLATLASFSAHAANYGSAVVAEITSVYDADTFRVNIANWPAIAGERIPIRVRGVDAPEIRARCDAEKYAAREAKQFTVAALRGAQVVELHNMDRGKYFRILADVYVDGQNLAELLIAAGHGRPYQGGKREGWCG
jgi:endonuclease YncB( thermonuclease family)